MTGNDVRIHRANEGEGAGQDDQQQGGKAPRYVEGPGFEIAVRAGSIREMEMQVPGRPEGPQEPRRPERPDQDSHRHPSIEARLTGVESALHAVVDQLRRVEEKVDALSRRPAQ